MITAHNPRILRATAAAILWRVLRDTGGVPTPDQHLHTSLGQAQAAAGWPDPRDWVDSAGCLILADTVLDGIGAGLSPVLIEQVHAWRDAPIDPHIEEDREGM